MNTELDSQYQSEMKKPPSASTLSLSDDSDSYDSSLSAINQVHVSSNIHDNLNCMSEQLSESNVSRMKRRVSFDKIQIRSYDMMLGDNPSTTYGPPISLDWDYHEETLVPLHEYETIRTGFRRRTYEMRMPPYFRRAILEKFGTTPDEIRAREKEMKEIRKNRERTHALLPFSKFEELAERVSRCKVSCKT